VALYAEALETIEENYVNQEALDSEKQAYGAIEGMIDSLGDEGHMRFLAPEEIEKTHDAVSEKRARASWHLIPGTEVAHLRLALFSKDAAKDLEEAIAEAQEAGAKRFVLHLRDNKGGLVKQAEKVAAQFLPAGSEIYTRNDAYGINKKIVSEGNKPLDAPLMVLVNGESASSAEIVVRTLARIVGKTLARIPAHALAPIFLHDCVTSSSKGFMRRRRRLSSMSKKTMSVYINNTWVHQQGRYWIAEALAFAENDNDERSPLAITPPS
jgi:C-terminal processing protease CtpA/Prc